MVTDSTLPHSETTRLRSIEERLNGIERRPNAIPMTFPAVPIFGTPQIDGYYSHNLSVMTDIFRADCYLTAPVFEYEIGATDAFATTGPSGLELQVKIFGFGAFADTIIDTLSASPPFTFTEKIDLVDIFDEDIMGRFASFRLSINQVGGTGHAAALRLERPLALRIREA